PKSAGSHPSPHHSPRRTSPTPHEVDTASEVEELDIDVSPAPYSSFRGAAKLQVFIARYSYNPYDGPNDNPEVELPLTAGEYIYVYGGMDDDGFYEGELMDGRRGLVPSNFVERVSDDDMMSAQLPEGTDISHNSLLDSSLHSISHRVRPGGPGTYERTEPAPVVSTPGPINVSVRSGVPGPISPGPLSPGPLSPALLTNGLDLDLEVGLDLVPYPRKLTLIKQLAKSIIIGWDGPLVPAGWGNVWSYNVFVDQELWLNVPFGSQTKAVLERLDVNLKAYRVSVQSLTERGTSDQLRCSMLVGRDVCVAPTRLRVDRVTATSASVAWLPSNSNYVHIVSLNEVEVELVKASCYSLSLSDLTPNQHYTIRVEARPHQTPWEMPPERRDHKTATTTFTTLAAGPPDAPLDVQLEPGPSPGIALISWLPVTIDAAGTSNGVRVTGYTIYADSKKVLEVSSPTAGSALLGPSQIQSLMAARELTVRTTSGHVESGDSMAVDVPAKLADVMTGQASTSCSSMPPLHQSPPVHRSPPIHQSPPFLTSSSPVQPQPHSHGNSAAKVSMLPDAMASPPSGVAQSAGLTRGQSPANCPPVHALHTEASSLRPSSYVDAWANPLAKSPDLTLMPSAVHEAIVSLTKAPEYQAKLPSSPSTYEATVSSPISPAYQAKCASVPSTYEAMMSPPISPAYQAKCASVPSTYEAMMSPPIAPACHAVLPLASHNNTTVSSTLPASPNSCRGPTASVEKGRADSASPGVPRDVMSIADFFPVDDYSRAILSTPEPCPSPTNAYVAPADDFHQGTHLLRPPKAPSPLESEPDFSIERSTARLASMDEFLKQEQDPGFIAQPKGYSGGLDEPPFGAAEASRGSDLSDILEEEEDDLYSDPPGSVFLRGHSTGANRENGKDPLMETAAEKSGQSDLSPMTTRPEVRQQVKESVEVIQPTGGDGVRIFVALFPYDPVNMSPNPDAAEEELPFKEGQIIKIYGDKDSDGFYRGESNGRHGYVPCNMVSEIQVEDEETRETLLRQGFLSTAGDMEKMGTRSHAQLPRRPVPPPKPRRSKKVESAALWEDSLDCSSQDPSGVGAGSVEGPSSHRMKAIFDYDPRESSPNADIEAELTFSAGDIIYVFGDMDDDGFFYGDLNGHKGLVPSNFLQAAPEAAGKSPSSEPQPPPQAVSHPRRESQVSPVPQLNQMTPEEVTPAPLNTGQTGPIPTAPQRLDPLSPTPAPRQATPGTPPSHVQEDSPSLPDQRGTSPPGKKKKGFFSKGKRLFKKLGSNKKD
ncbi:hypothetical protein DPEC_G00228280, partial [Dallia pectoralis]